MTRRQANALLLVKSHKPLNHTHQVSKFDFAFQLHHEEFQPINVLHVRYVILDADVLFHHWFLILLCFLARLLRTEDNRK